MSYKLDLKRIPGWRRRPVYIRVSWHGVAIHGNTIKDPPSVGIKYEQGKR